MSRRALLFAAKLLVSAGLLAFLLHRARLGPVLERLADADAAPMLAAFAVFLFQVALTGLRYARVGDALGAPMDAATAMRLVLVGHFFGQALPSAVGGDAVRIWMATRLGIPLGRAASAVLCDRGVAFLVLMAISLAAAPLFLARIADDAARLFLLVPALAVPGAVLAIALAREAPLAWLEARGVPRALPTLARDMRSTTRGPRSGAILALSVVAQLGFIASVWLAAAGLGLPVGFADCLVVVPPVVIATLLPLSIAGWGVREGAMVFGFGLLGVAAPDALALSILVGLANVAAGLPGAVLWLAERRVRPSG